MKQDIKDILLGIVIAFIFWTVALFWFNEISGRYLVKCLDGNKSETFYYATSQGYTVAFRGCKVNKN